MTKTGECAIRMRISVNGTRIDSNTGKYIDPALWNQSKERAKGTSKKCDRCTQTEVKVETTVKTVNVHTKDAPQEQKPSMVAESIAIYRRGFPTRKSAEFPRYKL